MPLNSLDFNQNLYTAPSGHVKTIHNINKDTSPSQQHHNHHQLQKELLEMSSNFERVLDALKLNRFQPNFKHSPLRAYADHPKRHQGHHISFILSQTEADLKLS